MRVVVIGATMPRVITVRRAQVEDNERARSLFERCGFEIEAFLREEYLIDGRYIDEVWMSRRVD